MIVAIGAETTSRIAPACHGKNNVKGISGHLFALMDILIGIQCAVIQPIVIACYFPYF
jgi:hypothetical protein